MIKAIRALLLIFCLSAVVATIISGNSWVGLRNAEATRLPIVPTTIVEDVGSITDASKLKALCTALAGVIKKEASERENRYRIFTEITKSAIKIAMFFSAASAIVLLAAWLALGKAEREVHAMRNSHGDTG